MALFTGKHFSWLSLRGHALQMFTLKRLHLPQTVTKSQMSTFLTRTSSLYKPIHCSCPCHNLYCSTDKTNTKYYSSKSELSGIEMIRNIGIMAHIDAGKTTTTERMLFYAGFTRHLGDVDDGDTVMDFMEQERKRGITINSAVITFHWNKHKVNLIDTPGHVDFTVEVERALRVLDGAVTILDASAGVEAQTLTVWRQADRYHIPRIVYINKMDKKGADFYASAQSLHDKLHVKPLLLQLPIGKENTYTGLVDLIRMQKLTWSDDTKEGRVYKRENLTLEVDADLYDKAYKARTELIESLADVDDNLADLVLADVEFSKIPLDIIYTALRKCTLQRQAVPVLCGSSLKNKGVQPLLDAVIKFLPCPSDIHHDFIHFYKDNLCALAFKIAHDKQRGILTYLRVYSGRLKSNSSIHNVNRACTEKVGKLLDVYADEHKDVAEAQAGNIIAVTGLKQTITGDTLVSTARAVTEAKKAYQATVKVSSHSTSQTSDPLDDSYVDPDDDHDPEHASDPVLAGLHVPDPVFLCAIEPPSISQQKALEHALACLTREDPSLKVSENVETGQIILSGMGELHLEIIQDRIKKEYGVDADLGDVYIAYRETLREETELTHSLNTVLRDVRHMVTVSLSVGPMSDQDKQLDQYTSNKFVFSIEPRDGSYIKERPLRSHLVKAVKAGIMSAVSRGPILNFQVVDLEVILHDLKVGRGTSIPMITSCVAQTLSEAFTKAQPVLMEPVMTLEIQTTETYLGSVLKDLSQRHSQILDIQVKSDFRVVLALTPLSQLMGYSTTLRTFTSGTASFSMELSHYHPMNEQQQREAVAKATGFLTF